MPDATRAIDILFRGDASSLDRALGQVETGLVDISQDAELAETKVDGLNDELGQMSASNVDALVVAFKALASAAVIKEFADANIELERFDRAMTAVTGSSKDAAAEWDYLRNLANTLGLNISGVADSYVSLSAATAKTSLEGAQTREIFEAVAIAMSSLGKSTADTEGALLAISQMVSKGTVSMEELTGQLGERLPGALGIASRALGLTTEELIALVSSGKLLTVDFLPKFAEGVKATFGDVQYIDGFTQSMERLNNTWNDFLRALGETGALDLAGKVIETGAKLLTYFSGEVEKATTLWGLFKQFISGEITFSEFRQNWSAAYSQIENDTLSAITRLGDVETKLGDAGAAALETSKNLASIRTATDGIVPAIDKVGTAVENVGSGSSTAGDALQTLIDDLYKSTGLWREGAENVQGFGDSLKESDQAALDSGRSWIEGADGVRIYADSLNALNPSLEDSTRSWIEWADGTRVYIDSANDAANASDKVAGGLDKTAESAKKASEAAQKTALELEKLASNERIANIEASVSLQTAQLEADAEKAVAIIDALSESISSTADLLSDLYSELSDVDNFRDRFLIEDQIKLENERREKDLKRLQKLTDAQIRLMNAQAAALQDGQAFITIDGAGLQPHLEAFMFAVLEAIQIKTNGEGLALLLGS